MTRESISQYFVQLQADICAGLEELDGKKQFISDPWQREDSSGGYGGGGVSRVLSDGGVFERGGVNFSEVHGTLDSLMSKKLVGEAEPQGFYATGVSLVLHPGSPMIPTTHANVRYLEVGGKSWFGGGADLTPYYFFEEDARHFHSVLKESCDVVEQSFYPKFKQWCDEYFYLPHRNEARGIGGVFFDYIGRDEPGELEKGFSLAQSVGQSFLECYLPIVKRRMAEPWGEAEREFQLLRRGRYVEFNLVFDRGTQFGLRTNGRAESILMSLPPVVHWQYDVSPKPGTREAKLLEILKSPRDWV